MGTGGGGMREGCGNWVQRFHGKSRELGEWRKKGGGKRWWELRTKGKET